MKSKGFTLIESLVALTIISVALLACLKAAGGLNLQQDELLKRQYALWSVQNAANHLRVAAVFPNQGAEQGRCDQGNFKFLCRVEISNTPNPNFRRVEITAQDAFAGDRSNQLARIVVFLSSAP
ncbi:MAG: type II secretion system minor pseudopilin GspI [Limnobacter sp.]|nr:type II secretion system minor pseudopilin GspI [Limnobacter sp.]